jgi:hypothetical protein
MIILQTVPLVGRVISLSQDLYLNIVQHKQNKCIHTPNIHALCGIRIIIPTSERAKTLHTLDNSASVTDPASIAFINNIMPVGINWLHFLFGVLV